jgi:hypothetical protein
LAIPSTNFGFQLNYSGHIGDRAIQVTHSPAQFATVTDRRYIARIDFERLIEILQGALVFVQL